MFVDTHTHLYDRAFDADRRQLIEKAKAAGIGKFFMPNVDLETVAPMLEVARQFPDTCVPMMGLHPTSVDDRYIEDLKEIARLARDGGYAAIGEIGIDLYHDRSRLREQQEAFATQAELALELNLPIVVHIRESFDQVYELLKAMPRRPKGIFHCFTGSAEQAGKLLALGDFWLGIGGVLTFKNSGLRDALQAVPLSRLVLETDAPYLAPVPFRGKRNEPAYMLEVARALSAAKEVSVHDVETATTANARAVFGPW